MEALVQSAVEGYHATIFAFGQTGAGKTYTTLGPRFVPCVGLSCSAKKVGHTSELMKEDGILPRAIHDIFHHLDQKKSAVQHMLVSVSCLEIYGERVTDLFGDGSKGAKNGLNVRYSAENASFIVEGLSHITVHDKREVFEILSKALSCRETRSNSLNDRSSRSHCITTLHLQTRFEDQRKKYTTILLSSTTVLLLFRYGKLSIVDLAGSERIKSTSHPNGQSLKETKAINKSLFTLGQVLWAVRCTSRGRAKEAPYRESKLTQLLWDGIRGNGRTLMIACCTPFQKHVEETLHTLKYAHTAIRIKTKPKIMLDPREQIIEDLKGEIKRLKNENRQLNQTIHQMQEKQKKSETGTSLGVVKSETNQSLGDLPAQLGIEDDMAHKVEDHRKSEVDKCDNVMISKDAFVVQSFPELESLEEEFHNNLMMQKESPLSSNSSLKEKKLSHDGVIRMHEMENSTSGDIPSRDSSLSQSLIALPPQSFEAQEISPHFDERCTTQMHRKQKRQERHPRIQEDFRAKIIEDLNRTREQIQKQRQCLMSKLQNQLQHNSRSHQWL